MEMENKIRDRIELISSAKTLKKKIDLVNLFKIELEGSLNTSSSFAEKSLTEITISSFLRLAESEKENSLIKLNKKSSSPTNLKKDDFSVYLCTEIRWLLNTFWKYDKTGVINCGKLLVPHLLYMSTSIKADSDVMDKVGCTIVESNINFTLLYESCKTFNSFVITRPEMWQQISKKCWCNMLNLIQTSAMRAILDSQEKENGRAARTGSIYNQINLLFETLLCLTQTDTCDALLEKSSSLFTFYIEVGKYFLVLYKQVNYTHLLRAMNMLLFECVASGGKGVCEFGSEFHEYMVLLWRKTDLTIAKDLRKELIRYFRYMFRFGYQLFEEDLSLYSLLEPSNLNIENLTRYQELQDLICLDMASDIQLRLLVQDCRKMVNSCFSAVNPYVADIGLVLNSLSMKTITAEWNSLEFLLLAAQVLLHEFVVKNTSQQLSDSGPSSKKQKREVDMCFHGLQEFLLGSISGKDTTARNVAMMCLCVAVEKYPELLIQMEMNWPSVIVEELRNPKWADLDFFCLFVIIMLDKINDLAVHFALEKTGETMIRAHLDFFLDKQMIKKLWDSIFQSRNSPATYMLLQRLLLHGLVEDLSEKVYFELILTNELGNIAVSKASIYSFCGFILELINYFSLFRNCRSIDNFIEKFTRWIAIKTFTFTSKEEQIDFSWILFLSTISAIISPKPQCFEKNSILGRTVKRSNQINNALSYSERVVEYSQNGVEGSTDFTNMEFAFIDNQLQVHHRQKRNKQYLGPSTFLLSLKVTLIEVVMTAIAEESTKLVKDMLSAKNYEGSLSQLLIFYASLQYLIKDANTEKLYEKLRLMAEELFEFFYSNVDGLNLKEIFGELTGKIIYKFMLHSVGQSNMSHFTAVMSTLTKLWKKNENCVSKSSSTLCVFMEKSELNDWHSWYHPLFHTKAQLMDSFIASYWIQATKFKQDHRYTLDDIGILYAVSIHMVNCHYSYFMGQQEMSVLFRNIMSAFGNSSQLKSPFAYIWTIRAIANLVKLIPSDETNEYEKSITSFVKYMQSLEGVFSNWRMKCELVNLYAEISRHSTMNQPDATKALVRLAYDDHSLVRAHACQKLEIAVIESSAEIFHFIDQPVSSELLNLLTGIFISRADLRDNISLQLFAGLLRQNVTKRDISNFFKNVLQSRNTLLKTVDNVINRWIYLWVTRSGSTMQNQPLQFEHLIDLPSSISEGQVNARIVGLKALLGLQSELETLDHVMNSDSLQWILLKSPHSKVQVNRILARIKPTLTCIQNVILGLLLATNEEDNTVSRYPKYEKLIQCFPKIGIAEQIPQCSHKQVIKSIASLLEYCEVDMKNIFLRPTIEYVISRIRLEIHHAITCQLKFIYLRSMCLFIAMSLEYQPVSILIDILCPYLCDMLTDSELFPLVVKMVTSFVSICEITPNVLLGCAQVADTFIISKISAAEQVELVKACLDNFQLLTVGSGDTLESRILRFIIQTVRWCIGVTCDQDLNLFQSFLSTDLGVGKNSLWSFISDIKNQEYWNSKAFFTKIHQKMVEHEIPIGNHFLKAAFVLNVDTTYHLHHIPRFLALQSPIDPSYDASTVIKQKLRHLLATNAMDHDCYFSCVQYLCETRATSFRNQKTIDMCLDFDKKLEYPEWIKNLVSKLIANYLSELSILCTPCVQVQGLAEFLFPIVIHQTIRKSEMRDQLSNFFNTLFNEATDPRMVTSVFNVIIFLRYCPNFNGKWMENFQWLELDWVSCARAALRCHNYQFCLMAIEIWRELTTKEASDIQNVDSILTSAYKGMNDVDAFYSVNPTKDFKSVHALYTHENKWMEAAFVSNAMTKIKGKSADTDLLEALHHLDLHSLLLNCNQTENQDSLVPIQLESAWRNQNWSLYTKVSLDDKTPSRSLHGMLYVQLASIAGAHHISYTCSNADYLFKSLPEPMGILLNLQSDIESISSILNTESSCNLSVIAENWLREGVKIMINIPFQSSELVFAVRCALLESTCQRLNLSAGDNVMEHLFAITMMFAKFARKSRRNDKATVLFYKLESLYEQFWNKECCFHKKIDIYIDHAKLLWEKGEKDIAIVILRNLLKALDPSCFSINGENLISGAKLFCRLGKWMSEMRTLPSKTIYQEYFSKSMSLLSSAAGFVPDSSENSHKQIFSKLYFAVAEFSDKQFELMANANCFDSLAKVVSEKKEELLELTQQGTPVENPNIRRLTAQVKLDEENIKLNESNKSLHLSRAVENYFKSLYYGDRLDQSIFRLCALWFENTRSDRVNHIFAKYTLKVKSRKFLCLLPQLAARFSSQDSQLLEERNFHVILGRLLEKIAVDHPHHSLFSLFALKNSSKDRSAIEKRPNAVTLLLERLKKNNVVRKKVFGTELLVQAYVELAYLQVPKKPKRDVDGLIPLPSDALIRKIRDLQCIPIPTKSLQPHDDCEYKDIIYISTYSAGYRVMGGINLPKVMELIGSDGQKYQQLVKGRDDLRQDAVMQQVFLVFDRVLSKNKETRQRDLRIRNYIVIPLTSTSGILEFVQNSLPLGDYLIPAHEKYNPCDLKPSECRKIMSNVSDRDNVPISEKIETFTVKILSHFRPVLRHLFFESYIDPKEWHEKRRTYTRSAACSSILGYILGIGDRHPQNILIDKISAEMVHIDLGIAFDQGKMLRTPESVPFRLTQDIIDAMGVAGIEGTFRRCCEETLIVLREQSKILITILEVLKYDPLYSWTISPATAAKLKKQRSGNALLTENINSNGNASTNKDARRAIIKVHEKLQGVEESSILSIKGHISLLLNSAMNTENLCSMFSGWQSWL